MAVLPLRYSFLYNRKFRWNFLLYKKVAKNMAIYVERWYNYSISLVKNTIVERRRIEYDKEV